MGENNFVIFLGCIRLEKDDVIGMRNLTFGIYFILFFL